VAATTSVRPTEGHAVELTAASAGFGGTEVLDAVDLTVGFGESVAIVGENGAGKTTLLRLCAGLLAPSAGAVTHHGTVGYCPQEPGVVDLLDADQHLVLFGSVLGLRRADALRRGHRLLDELGFPVGERTVVRDLSGGTRQKLNLALALLGDPEVLLLDEPYQGFDHGSYVDFWHHVEDWRAAGRAVLVVTHLLTETDRVDRVVEVRDGGVEDRSVAAAGEVAP
jgi:ABC-2 type transport system ATP-binding protein